MPNLIGTAPNQVPTNGTLGTAAFVDVGQLPVSAPQQAALDAKSPIASPTFTGTVAGITSAMVGLGNVNNTSDAAKPVSTATQAALDTKANRAATVLVPSATATPANNGEMVFELTSNTSLTVKVKGSDGTVRSVVLTLA